MRWGRFLLFCVGVAFLAALTVVLTGHGLLIRQVITSPSPGLKCDYLTIRGIFTKDFNYGDFNFGRWECPLVIDPNHPGL